MYSFCHECDQRIEPENALAVFCAACLPKVQQLPGTFRFLRDRIAELEEEFRNRPELAQDLAWSKHAVFVLRTVADAALKRTVTAEEVETWPEAESGSQEYRGQK